MSFPLELQAARLKLAQARPYLAAALWALQPVARPGLGSMAVDRWWRVYFDPAAVQGWSVDEAAGVLYHEICHLLRDHPARFEALDPALANIATDAEINDDLVAEHIRLPGQPVTPQVLGLEPYRLAEEYYEALRKRGQASHGAAASAAGDSKAVGAGASTASVPTAQSPAAGGDRVSPVQDSAGATNPNAAAPSSFDPPRPGAGRCGSCATGRPEPWEEGPPGEGTVPGISPIEGELIRREVARRIQEATRQRGAVPAHWVRWAEEKLRPRVDWRRELAAAIRRAIYDVAGSVDYSYRRPSRRQGQVGNGKVLLPSMRKPVPNVAIVVDTSGSVSDEMLSQALAEIRGVLKAVGQGEGAHVLSCDAAVHSCRRVFRPDQIQLAGGGGTDMGVGIAAAVKLRPRPDVVIVITDGYTPWPDTPPAGVRVVVALLGGGKAPEWARAVEVKR